MVAGQAEDLLTRRDEILPTICFEELPCTFLPGGSDLLATIPEEVEGETEVLLVLRVPLDRSRGAGWCR